MAVILAFQSMNSQICVRTVTIIEKSESYDMSGFWKHTY